MSNVFFISDLHIDHKRILEFSPERGGTCIDSHNEWLISCISSVVKKNDILYILGDVSFSREGLRLLKQIPGQKALALGNHDREGIEEYQKYFFDIFGIKKKYGFWLSHAPVHPDELRGKPSVHGHTHSYCIPDKRYVNVSVEVLGGIPVSLDELRRTMEQRNGLRAIPIGHEPLRKVEVSG